MERVWNGKASEVRNIVLPFQAHVTQGAPRDRMGLEFILRLARKNPWIEALSVVVVRA